jgi:hypothetical protein
VSARPADFPMLRKAHKPHPVFCVIEDRHRSAAIADDACAGRFTAAGTTISVGPGPDWLNGGLADDEEWRIEWSKFYFGLDLAWAHRATGEHAYLEAWESLVASWIEQVPVDHDPPDVIGRRLQNWVYAWQGFTAGGGPGPSQHTVDLLSTSIPAQTAYLRNNLTPERNHRTLELYALMITAIALPDLDPFGDTAQFAWDALQANLLQDIWPDGVHRECSSHYHLIALRSFLAARENARLAELDVPAAYDARLRLACRFAMHLHRPDGSIPALSDSDSDDHRDVLSLAARLLDDPALRWVATSGEAGSPPHETGVAFPCAGYVVQRSGWGSGDEPYADERYLVFDAGPVGDGGHGHYDQLSLEAYGLGRPLVVDPGRYTYSEAGPNWRHWFKGTAAHNTVTVDDADSTPYRRGRPRKGTAAEARLVWRHRCEEVDMLRAVLHATSYDAVHTRSVAFLAGEYWIVEDRLEAATAHDYTHRMHLDDAAWRRAAVRRREGDVIVEMPGGALVYPAPDTPVLAEGWVSRMYGVKAPAPVATTTRTGECSTGFLTVLVPLRAGREAPRLTVLQQDDRGLSVRLDGVGPDGTETDHVGWAWASAAEASSVEPVLDLGVVAGAARLGWVRTGSGGDVRRMALYDTGDLTWAGSGPSPDLDDGAGDGWSVLHTKEAT